MQSSTDELGTGHPTSDKSALLIHRSRAAEPVRDAVLRLDHRLLAARAIPVPVHHQLLRRGAIVHLFHGLCAQEKGTSDPRL